MSDGPEVSDGISGLLRELVAWQRLAHQPTLKSLLHAALSTDNDRAVYELTDGTRNQTQVAGEVEISSRAVGYKWEAWRQAGLLVATDDPKRPRHLLSVAALGGI